MKLNTSNKYIANSEMQLIFTISVVVSVYLEIILSDKKVEEHHDFDYEE